MGVFYVIACVLFGKYWKVFLKLSDSLIEWIFLTCLSLSAKNMEPFVLINARLNTSNYKMNYQCVFSLIVANVEDRDFLISYVR